MPFNAFTPAQGPDLPIQKESRADIREIKFGDGYRQEQGRDINHIDETVTLTWSNITGAIYEDIIGFFEDQKGYLRFTYTIPQSGEANKTWVCKAWAGEIVHYDVYNIKATFDRRFDVA